MNAKRQFREAMNGLLCGLMWLAYFAGAVVIVILVQGYLPRPLSRFLSGMEPEFLLFLPLMVIGAGCAVVSLVKDMIQRKRKAALRARRNA